MPGTPVPWDTTGSYLVNTLIARSGARVQVRHAAPLRCDAPRAVLHAALERRAMSHASGQVRAAPLAPPRTARRALLRAASHRRRRGGGARSDREGEGGHRKARGDGAGQGGHRGGGNAREGEGGRVGFGAKAGATCAIGQTACARKANSTGHNRMLVSQRTHCSNRNMCSIVARPSNAQRLSASCAARCILRRAMSHAARHVLRPWPRHEQLGARSFAPRRAAGVGSGRWGRGERTPRRGGTRGKGTELG